MSKEYFEKFLYIAVVSFIFMHLIFGIELLDALSYSVSFSTFISYCYSKFLWRYNPLESTPRLMKKYVAKLNYVYNGKRYTKKVDIVINQDLFSVKVCMKSNESFSKAVTANIYQEQNVWYLTYTYINEPSQMVRDRSRIHYGTCKLNLSDINNIQGEYFTDRLSCGDIDFIKKK